MTAALTPACHVRKAIAKWLEVDPADITDGKHLRLGLGADTLSMMDVIMEVEDALEVEIDDDIIEQIVTVGDLIGWAEKLVGEAAVAA
ncbi:acyl carrier protein [Paraburkholderia fungorum]|uniref:acyl carrier protein n=1 Tax=Paraburkholderia fungorum TaxID=134537 RepID=UPI003D6A65CD